MTQPRQTTREPRAAGSWKPWALGVAWIAALCVVLYARTARFEYTHTDDTVLIVENATFLGDVGNVGEVFRRPFFQSSGRGEPYYRPIVTLTFMLDAQWGTESAAAFHVTNVAIHVVACCLLLLLLRTLGAGSLIATAAASMFAAHPALVEAVAWIPGRVDPLLAVWTMAALLALQRFIERASRAAFAVHLGFTFLALLTKEAAVVLPVLWIAFVVLVGEHRRLLKRAPLWIGWACVLGAWMLLWRTASSSDGAGETIGGRVTTFVESLPVVLMHLGKIVFPYKLSVLAIREDTPWLSGAVALLLSGAGALWLRGAARRLYLWGLGLFLSFVLPTLPVSDFLILENRLYVPAVGIVVALVAIARHGVSLLPARQAGRAIVAAGAVLTGVLAFATLSYMESFRDQPSFARAAVAQSPRSPLAHLNLGVSHHRRERIEEAEREYAAALRLRPDQPVLHNNIGLIYMNRGELREAERELRLEIALNPNYGKAHYNLGLVLSRMGRADEGARAYERCLATEPSNADSLGELMVYHMQRGETAKALHYRHRLEALGFAFQ